MRAPTATVRSPESVAGGSPREWIPSFKYAWRRWLLTVSFKAPIAGTAKVSWYILLLGGHIASVKPVVVATGTVRFDPAGTKKLKVKLTAAGKRLLAHAGSLKLTAKGASRRWAWAP